MGRYQFSETERRLLESIPAPIGIYQYVDKRVVALILSDGFCRLFGYHDRARAYYDMDNDMYRNVHPDDAARVAEEAVRFIGSERQYEVIYRAKKCDESEYHIIHIIGEHIYPKEGVRLGFVWYTNEGAYAGDADLKGQELNLTLGQALHEESILKSSYFDYLTGLPSMTYFFELAESGKVKILREGGWPVLLYMDFDNMKSFNNRFGFAAGDRMLCDFAQILIRRFDRNSCSHFGADHFVVLTKEEGLERILQELFEECRNLNGGDSLPLRVGVYSARLEDVPASTACDRAKTACDALRGTYNSGWFYYSRELQDGEARKQYIRKNLDRAMEEGWISVYYQPIIRAVDGKVCDEEALSRWIDPVVGFLSPADFIPALEEARLIYKLDLYVVEQVLEKIKRQARSGMYVVPQSVNLSRVDFESCDIVEEIRRRVDDSGIDRSMLTIEITESVVGRDFDFMKEQISRFQMLGFQVWMDDFGSGYSSLDVLQEIHFDLIKFDMRFMQRFDSGYEGKIILTELTKMAIGLGMETVCEGVERTEQVEFLREIGCTKLQGYYYSRPIPFEDMLKLYESGVDMGFENPEESDYYEILGNIDLYDMSVLSSDEDESLRRYFDSLPMAIMEVTGTRARYTRCNQSYHDFMERVFHISLTGKELDYADIPDQSRAAFMGAILRCSRDGNRAIIDEMVSSNTTLHLFIRRVAINPVTGAAAIVVAILAIIEEKDSPAVTYENIAWALSLDYINLYYVDLETDEFIEYTSDTRHENMVAERRGADFFGASLSNAPLFIHEEDRDHFINSFTKENVIRALDEEGSFVLIYRLVIEGSPCYVRLKAVRMKTDSGHIIIGVSNVDEQVRREKDYKRKLSASCSSSTK